MYFKLVVIAFVLSSVGYVDGNNLQIQNKSCTCVPFYQCTENDEKVIVDAAGLIETREFQTNICSGYYEVCCDLSSENPTSEEEELESPKGCGYHNSKAFSWTVGLYYQAARGYPITYKCGASLIGTQVLVTSAHCLTTGTNQGIWTVQIGVVQRKLRKVIVHRGYNSLTMKNNVALGILNEPVKTSERLNVICIPPPSIVLDQTTCILSSVKDQNSLGTYYPKLTNLPLVSRLKCQRALRQTKLGAFFRLHRSFICAGGEANHDACRGDGGSPLVCPVSSQPGRYHQVGLVSWGIGCGKQDMPGVYVNLAIFRDWIDEKMIAFGFSINSYRY